MTHLSCNQTHRMAILQTRIFAKHTEPWDWAETLIGRVLKPLTREYCSQLEWFWFSRYVCQIGMAGEDKGDCDFDSIPQIFKGHFPQTSIAGHRSLRFRFQLDDEVKDQFEQRLRELLATFDYAISDVRSYDEVADTGSERFLGAENALSNRAPVRARLVTQIYHTTSQLLLDTLVGPDADGRYRVENNELRNQNPNGCTFESVHHVFCNISSVPTSILFRNQAGQQSLHGTYWGKPRGSRDISSSNGETFTEVYIPY